MSYKGIVFLASLVLLIGLDFTLGYAQEQKKTPATKVEITLSFAPLVKKAAPAVVNIYTKKTVTASSRKRIFDENIFKERFRTIGRIFGWEDKFKRLIVRFERISALHYSLKYLAFGLINLRHFS